MGISKQYEGETVNIEKKRSIRHFSVIIKITKSTFLPYTKKMSNRFNYLFLCMIISLEMEILNF